MSSELGLDEYTIFRCDRSMLTSTRNRGGGVLIAVKSTLRCSEISITCRNIEQIFVAVYNGKNIAVLGAVYLAPLSPSALYEEHCNTIMEALNLHPGCDICICGDYNLPHIDWINYHSALSFSSRPDTSSNEMSSADYILQTFNYHNCYQLNTICNTGGNTLDLFFANNNAICTRSIEELVPCDKYHPPLHITIRSSGMCHIARDNREYFEFRCGDYRGICDYLNEIQWDHLLMIPDLDEAVDILYSHLYFAIEHFIPKATARRSSYPKWFSPQLIKLIREKNYAHRIFKRTCSFSDYLCFSKLRTDCKSMSKQCYRSYTQNIESTMQHNIKSFWGFVNTKRKSPGIPLVTFNNLQRSTDDFSTANLFASYFGSVYVPVSAALPISDNGYSACIAAFTLILVTFSLGLTLWM